MNSVVLLKHRPGFTHEVTSCHFWSDLRERLQMWTTSRSGLSGGQKKIVNLKTKIKGNDSQGSDELWYGFLLGHNQKNQPFSLEFSPNRTLTRDRGFITLFGWKVDTDSMTEECIYTTKIKQKAIWYRCGSKLEQLSVEKLALAGYFFLSLQLIQPKFETLSI